MWIDEVGNKLPNSFHDSIVDEINIDYINKTVKIILQIDFSDCKKRESYKYCRGVLVISGVKFISIDEPKKTIVDKIGEIFASDNGIIKKYETEKYRGYYFFVSKWNGFIKICGESAELTWL